MADSEVFVARGRFKVAVIQEEHTDIKKDISRAAKNCTFTPKLKNNRKKPPVTSCYLAGSSKGTLKNVDSVKKIFYESKRTKMNIKQAFKKSKKYHKSALIAQNTPPKVIDQIVKQIRGIFFYKDMVS